MLLIYVYEMLFPRRRWCQCLMCGSLAMQESAEKLPLGKEEHADVPKVLPFQWWCLTSAVVTADMFWWTNDRSHAFSCRRWCRLLRERERERESTGEGTHITRGSVCVSVATQESAEKPPLEKQRPDVPKVLQTIPLRSVFSRRC